MDDQNDLINSSDKPKEVIPGKNDKEIHNPWRLPINQITWGFALTSFTLNFLLLQYLLPSIGIVLMFLGFRSLRKENKWFYGAWILSLCKLIWQALQLALCATPLNDNINNTPLKLFVLIMQIMLLLFYRKALLEAFRYSDNKNINAPSMAIIWSLLIFLFSLLPLVYFYYAFIPLIIYCIVIIRSLYGLGDALIDVPKAAVDTRVKPIDKVFLFGYLLCCLILVLSICVISNHLTLDATEVVELSESETRSELLQLGFPSEIIKDISDKDISYLANAIHVDFSSDTLMYDPRQVTHKSKLNQIIVTNQPGNTNLEATTIYIELPDSLMYVIEYFNWKDCRAYWQDGFTIWGEKGLELLNGALLFKQNSIDYTAPIPRLMCKSVTSNSFFGTSETRQIIGAVSYPFGSEDQRGYIIYRVQLEKDRWYGCSCLNYFHYNYPFQYPYYDTEERILKSNYIQRDALQQHYTNFETELSRITNK